MEEYSFKDKENVKIVYYKWNEVKEKPKGIVQIAHGMEERALRYDYFARKLNEKGFIVYANDHRGHGLTARSKEDLGYIADNDGFNLMVDDLNQLTNLIKKENKDIPVILFGHSMGSFLCQRYIEKYSHDIDCLILSGTNGKPKFFTKFGILISKFEMMVYGRRHISNVMEKLSVGAYNKKFKNPRTDSDWLTTDEKYIDDFIKDEYCGFTCTSSFYYDLIKGLWEIHRKENLENIPKDLPIYIFAGDKDPVGYEGKGIISLYNTYKNLNIKDVRYKLYEGYRHEMLNEKIKDIVIDDVLRWINNTI